SGPAPAQGGDGPGRGARMRHIVGFFRFWYDFLVGDSWQIAVGVLLVVIVTRLLIAAQPQLAQAAGPALFLALLAGFCGVLFQEKRRRYQRISEATIQEAVELLRRAADPSRIILFGSYARGDARENSDLDFLVTQPVVTARRREMVRLSNVLRPL